MLNYVKSIIANYFLLRTTLCLLTISVPIYCCQIRAIYSYFVPKISTKLAGAGNPNLDFDATDRICLMLFTCMLS